MRGAARKFGNVPGGQTGHHFKYGTGAKTIDIGSHIALEDIHESRCRLRTRDFHAVDSDMQKPTCSLIENDRLAVENKRRLLRAAVSGETAQRRNHLHHIFTRNAGSARQFVAGEDADHIKCPARLDRIKRINEFPFGIEIVKALKIVLVNVAHVLVKNAVIEGAKPLKFVIAKPRKRHEFIKLALGDGRNVVSAIFDEFGHHREIIGIKAPFFRSEYFKCSAAFNSIRRIRIHHCRRRAERFKKIKRCSKRYFSAHERLVDADRTRD